MQYKELDNVICTPNNITKIKINTIDLNGGTKLYG